METVEPQISPEYWAWVRDLIRDIEREEKRDEFLRKLFQWDLAVREFRKAELGRMILGDPTETDFHFHAICLHSLLAIGHSLILLSEGIGPKDLAHWSVEHGHIAAYVQELKQSYREWHHGFSEQEVVAAKTALFGGST